MSEKAAKGLGKGLSALLGDSSRPMPETSFPSANGVREIEIARITPNPDQPRRHFDDAALADLAHSIRERGVIQPILLRTDGDNFQIVAGERRWRAAQQAHLHSIPAIVREINAGTSAELALIENIQREDLNVVEEAEGYRKLIERHGHTQEALAQIVHKSRSHVANLLRLLDLPESVRDSLIKGDISMGHARAVATAPEPEALVREIIAKGLSVRQAEARARRAKQGPGELVLTERTANSDLAALERQLGDMLGLKVQVSHKGHGGSVTLQYSSLEQLDMICQRLSGEPI